MKEVFIVKSRSQEFKSDEIHEHEEFDTYDKARDFILSQRDYNPMRDVLTAKTATELGIEFIKQPIAERPEFFIEKVFRKKD